MTNKTEIILDKQKVIRFFKSLVLSLVLSFFLLLITALFGNIAPAHPQNKWNSDVCYFGILNNDGYSGTNESIQVLYDYTMDVDDLLTGNYFHQKGIAGWSIPKTIFGSARKDEKITFFDKLIVIYLPLIFLNNFLIWFCLSILIYIIISLKSRYKVKIV